MNMIEEVTQALGSFSLRNEKGDMKFVSGKVPIYLHLSLYRALEQTFSLDIKDLGHDDTIEKEMGFRFMSQTVGVLIPIMFISGTKFL